MKLAVLALVLLGACAPDAGPLLLAYEGSPEGHRAAELAVAEWVDTCHVDVRLDPAGIPLVETDERIPPGRGAVTRTVGAEPEWIHFLSQTTFEGTQFVIAHEIGHALGLDHTPDGVADVMAAEDTGEHHVRAENCLAYP